MFWHGVQYEPVWRERGGAANCVTKLPGEKTLITLSTLCVTMDVTSWRFHGDFAEDPLKHPKNPIKPTKTIQKPSLKSEIPFNITHHFSPPIRIRSQELPKQRHATCQALRRAGLRLCQCLGGSGGRWSHGEVPTRPHGARGALTVLTRKRAALGEEYFLGYM